MTLATMLSSAIKDVLTDTLTLAESVHHDIRSDLVVEFNNRVLVVGDNAELRHKHVPGFFDVTGRVLVQQSIDTEDSVSKFNALSAEVCQALANKYNMPQLIEDKNPSLLIHSFNFNQQEAIPSERGFQSVFGWDVAAESQN